MYRRGGHNDLQNWKERFAQLMKEHKPQDCWTLDVAEVLRLSPRGWYQYGQRHLFARFECSGCSKCWKSAWSAILFHICLQWSWGQNQGQVKMWMFRQKCRRCTTARYEEPLFSEKALDTILYNLALKILEKSYGEPQRSPRPCDVEETVEGPHDERHCGACKHGMCIETQTFWPTATPTSPALSIEWERNFMRPAPLTPSTEWQRKVAGPASVSQPECLKILFALFLVIVTAFFASLCILLPKVVGENLPCRLV